MRVGRLLVALICFLLTLLLDAAKSLCSVSPAGADNCLSFMALAMLKNLLVVFLRFRR